jgi:Phage major capsid protein E
MLDIFNPSNAAFSVTSLTMALNRMPYVPGRIGSLGLFTTKRLSTISTTIEVQSGRLAFVPSTPRGAPPALNVEDRRELIPFLIPHFPLSDAVLADSVQGVRAFGTEDQLEAVQSIVNERLASMGRKHDVTLEYLRLGAVKSRIITRTNRDSGVPEVAIDLRNAFNLPAKPLTYTPPPPSPAGPIPYDQDWFIDFTNSAAVLDDYSLIAMQGVLTQLVLDLQRLVSDNLGAQTFTGLHGIAGRKAFDAFAKHPEIRTTFLNQPSADRLRDPFWQTSIPFRGITIEEYRGQVGNVKFVEDEMIYFFPVGVPDLFVEAYAPADYMETVNTVALPRYAKQEAMQFDRGINIETQQNVLPLCTQPDCLIAVRVRDFDDAP